MNEKVWVGEKARNPTRMAMRVHIDARDDVSASS